MSVFVDLGIVESSEIKSVTVTEAAQISLARSLENPSADSWAAHFAIMHGII